MTKDIEWSVEERTYMQNFLKDACGLVIPDEKEYLLTFRLQPIMAARTYTKYQELCDALAAGDAKLSEEVITQLTTHETFFFRDKHPFDFFNRDVLPSLEKIIVERKKNPHARMGSKARIWCAAASTGQEPYSLSMLIQEYAKKSSIDVKDIDILATDVSSAVLADAINGMYKEFELGRGLDAFDETFREKFFDKLDKTYEVVDDLKDMVEYKYCNLNTPFAQLGTFDVIFCRNVLIYFDENDKKNILEQFHKMLTPEGCLVLGASENVHGLATSFAAERSEETLFYKKEENVVKSL